ncbi:hypothetical protein F4803DRAFT_576835, partial [Xylaria telfairii]
SELLRDCVGFFFLVLAPCCYSLVYARVLECDFRVDVFFYSLGSRVCVLFHVRDRGARDLSASFFRDSFFFRAGVL